MIETLQTNTEANQNEINIEDASDLLFKDGGDKIHQIEQMEKELQQYQFVNRNLLNQVKELSDRNEAFLQEVGDLKLSVEHKE